MAKNAVPAINIGISEKDRAAIAKGLSSLLADTYTLYLTTHNFHWNVTGPMFNTLHTMFMTQYTELWNAVDPIAERIRSLGHAAPGSYGQFGKLASVPDAPAKPPKAMAAGSAGADWSRRRRVSVMARRQRGGRAVQEAPLSVRAKTPARAQGCLAASGRCPCPPAGRPRGR